MFLGQKKDYKEYNSVSLPLTPCLHASQKVEPKEVKWPKLSHIQAYLRDIVDSVPDHLNKENNAIKQVTQKFWLPSAHKSCVYTIL